MKHPLFQRSSKLDQSMFARLIRLGVPYVQLDQQGRSRAEIAALYSWRYSSTAHTLGNLPFIDTRAGEYSKANAGFRFSFQAVDVPGAGSYLVAIVKSSHLSYIYLQILKGVGNTRLVHTAIKI